MDDSKSISISRRTLFLHLAVHILTVGFATAEFLFLLRDWLSFSVQVALVFVVVSLTIFPAQQLIASARGTAALSTRRWLVSASVIALVIYFASRLIDRA